MAKRKREATPKKFDKWIKEGRGQGIGSEYKPWLTIQDVPSDGRATRTFGMTCQRMHHFMSDLERNSFYLFDWSDSVSDIREQFPLLPLEETLAIADELGLKHPTDPKTNEPVVMSTDFLLTDNALEVAYAVKPASGLEDQRTIEKLEIERRYWTKRNISWQLITDEDIPMNVVRNIEWFYKEFVNEDIQALGAFTVNNIEKFVYTQLLEQISLSKATALCDEKLGLEAGVSLAMIKHFFASKRWAVEDMNIRIYPEKPLQNISIHQNWQARDVLGG